jgi:exodeoxyribonuclease VII small subunit
LAKRKENDEPLFGESAGDPTFEESLEQLEAIVHALEDGQLSLADSLQQYEGGVANLRRCYQLLQKAERKIELLTGLDAAGNPLTEPFADEAASLEEQAGTRRRTRGSGAGKTTEG